MIADTITQKIGEALKAKQEIRLSTLRLLSSALNYEFIAKQHKLDKEEEIVVVRKEAKKRKEAIEAYEKAGATDRAQKEQKELEILQEFLPPEMSEEELEKIVIETILKTNSSSISDMGKVIGIVMGKVKGTVEGSRVSLLVKEKLLS
ncbi:GatB/YqeY domain-containing protein [Patescibacteria group bacterium]|nr:GatB/YqeY domain-containing protein [Patescibacteria group bacterium]